MMTLKDFLKLEELEFESLREYKTYYIDMTFKTSKHLWVASLICWLICAIGSLVFHFYEIPLGEDITFAGMWTFMIASYVTGYIYRNKNYSSL